MTGFTPSEGAELIADVLYDQDTTDNDNGYEMALFIGGTVDGTITEATLSEPGVGSYARQAVSFSTTATPGERTDTVDFTPSGADWSGANAIYGWALITKTTAGTQRIVHCENDPVAPVTVSDGETYRVDLTQVPA